MARSGTPGPASAEQSLGELVSLATKDISQLVRYEVDLAKTELRADLRRVTMAAVLFCITAFFGSLVLLSLCFAYGYGLNAAGAPGGIWGAFLLVSLTLAVLGVTAGLFAVLMMRHLSRMKKTRESVTEGIGMLRRDGKDGKDGEGAKDGRSVKNGKKTRKTEDAMDALDQVTADRASRTSLRSAVDPPADAVLPDGQRPEIAGRKPR
jgi:hypothetical protein